MKLKPSHMLESKPTLPMLSEH